MLGGWGRNERDGKGGASRRNEGRNGAKALGCIGLKSSVRWLAFAGYWNR